MLFSSSVFLAVFLPCVLAVYHGLLRGHRRAQNLFLLLSSLFFSTGGASPKFVLVMVLSIVMNYLFGLWTAAFRARGRELTAPIACTVAANLAILFVFKYLDFTVRNLNLLGFDLDAARHFAAHRHFLFHLSGHELRVRRCPRAAAACRRTPLNVGLYIALFPQLVAGPIVQISKPWPHEILHRKEQLGRFCRGRAPRF